MKPTADQILIENALIDIVPYWGFNKPELRCYGGDQLCVDYREDRIPKEIEDQIRQGVDFDQLRSEAEAAIKRTLGRNYKRLVAAVDYMHHEKGWVSVSVRLRKKLKLVYCTACMNVVHKLDSKKTCDECAEHRRAEARRLAARPRCARCEQAFESRQLKTQHHLCQGCLEDLAAQAWTQLSGPATKPVKEASAVRISTDDASEAVAQDLASNPGSLVTEIAKRTGLQPPGVRRALGVLKKAGRAAISGREGRRNLWSVA